jgi:hypothetical protein
MQIDEHAPMVEDASRKRIYWHRELPPLEAEMLGEHVLEAMSSRVPSSLARDGELWNRAYHELMENTQTRMAQRSTGSEVTIRMCSTNQSTAGAMKRPVKRGSTVSSRTRCIADSFP